MEEVGIDPLLLFRHYGTRCFKRRVSMASKAEKLIEVLEPLASDHGLDLVTVEVAGTTKNPILRVYLDTLEGGINLDQLAAAQEWVDAAIEELDPFKESYVLEVSSPGIDRPLRRLADYDRFAGEDVVIHLKSAQGKLKQTGVLAGTQGDQVVIDQDGEQLLVPVDNIKKANIKGRIDFSGGSKKNEADDAAQNKED